MRSHALDNIVWHAAAGHQSDLAEHLGDAARFDPDVVPFAAVSDITSAAAWVDLATLVGDEVAILFAPNVVVPDGWSRDVAIPCVQMVASGVIVGERDVDVVELGPADVSEMSELVEATRPGPFRPRTIELGRYVGIREDGRLVAMAGERFRTPGFTEISLVCTAEHARGRGLARALVFEVTDAIRARGDEAVLHVLSDNAPAIALYRSMGFEVRTEAEAVAVHREGA